MPRRLTSHMVPGDSANHQIEIVATDGPGPGGANHKYEISGPDPSGDKNLRWSTVLMFQNGPIKEVGVNGVTHEALLAIVIDRLESFQKGPYNCAENEFALTSCRLALTMMQDRTRERMRRGVEGTHQK
jgi:hypothetical protein